VVFATLSAAGIGTVESFACFVPLSVQLQSTFGMLFGSTDTEVTETLNGPVENGAITAAVALSRLVMSALLMLDACEARSATVRAASVTLRLMLTPCEISTAPR
jgi:hypothetical protein